MSAAEPAAMPLDAAVAATVRRLAALGPTPELAVVLGSGWDGIASLVEDPVDVAYAELPAFPPSGVAGHAGVLRAGRVAGRPVWLLRGRRHAYEDGDAAAMKGAIRALAAAGVTTLVLTNAAGSLRRAMAPGSLMLVADHLNLAQRTPLLGEPGDARFVPMTDAYDPALREQAQRVAGRLGIALPEGVYAWMLGPQFETPAEIRMLNVLGAHAVGMSTVPETILARHAGLQVLALSMITNLAAGLSDEPLGHAHTLAVAREGAAAAGQLLAALLPELGAG